MKILFMGTPRFAEIVLEGLFESEFQVVGVVCQTDKPAGRGNKMVSPNIVELAKRHDVPVFQFSKISEHIEEFKSLDYDTAVTASFGKMLPKTFLEIKPVVNVHPSLLPKYRGATPIQSAILNGDKVTGVSIIKTEIGMDDGDIFVKKEMQILEDDDYISLIDKLAVLGKDLLIDTLKKIQSGTAIKTPQNASQATFVKLIKNEDGLLDFNTSVEALVNKVRAFVESPTAYFFLGDDRIKVFKAKLAPMCSCANVGEIIPNKKRFLVQANNGVFEILKCQVAGGKLLDASNFLNGYRFNAMVVKV